jgi:hypothetical protein
MISDNGGKGLGEEECFCQIKLNGLDGPSGTTAVVPAHRKVGGWKVISKFISRGRFGTDVLGLRVFLYASKIRPIDELALHHRPAAAGTV